MSPTLFMSKNEYKMLSKCYVVLAIESCCHTRLLDILDGSLIDEDVELGHIHMVGPILLNHIQREGKVAMLAD